MDTGIGEGIWIDLGKVTEGPGPYTMSYGFNLETLCESIRKAGLLNPPLVSRNKEGGFDIVSGFRRIMALKRMGEPKAFCRDATTVLSSPMERFLAAFYENLATRKFNAIEKAMILHKLQGYVPRQEIVAFFMPLLSLPSHEHTFEFYLKLLGLEDSIKEALAREEISINLAKALVELEKASQKALFHWIHKVKFNFNQQAKFIEYLKDISMREELTIPELLSEKPFLAIIEHPRLNNPQKAKAGLEILRVRRSPRLAKAQLAVEKVLSAITMPPEASIRYDPYLEDPYYHLEISFKRGKDLTKTISKLHALFELEAIPELWAGP